MHMRVYNPAAPVRAAPQRQQWTRVLRVSRTAFPQLPVHLPTSSPLFFSLPPLPGSHFAPPAAWSVQSVLGVAVLAHRSVWALWSLSSAAAAAVPLPVLVRPLLLFQCRRGRVCARVCALVSLSGHLAAPTPYFSSSRIALAAAGGALFV